MTPHLVTAAVILPLLTAIMLLFAARRSTLLHRLIGLMSVTLLFCISLWLLGVAAAGNHEVVAMGDWPAPFGIVLVLDRLSALMLVVMSVLAFCTLLFSTGDGDRSPYFPALFQFQLMGLSGAFLTGDLFNLFVFFEVLLMASYALLMQYSGADRSRAGFHYVVLNLAGSLLFLVGVGVLYGVAGTLNMADLALAVSQAPPEDQPLLATGGLILLVVFSLKAALLPLLFWLPSTYSAASPAVAALFAIMTKVGIYSILRVYPLIFGPLAGDLSGLAWDWLWVMGLATMIMALIGTLGAGTLRTMVAWQVILSMGMLASILSLAQAKAYGAVLFYLIHTTWVTGGLFLVAGLIKHQRGTASDVFGAAPRMRNNTALAVLFLVGSMGVIGLPPMSGFPAKVVLLESLDLGPGTAWAWSIIIGGGLISLIALSRAGTILFWRHSEGHFNDDRTLNPSCYVAALALIASSPLLSLAAEPVLEFTLAAGVQISTPEVYIEAVLGQERAAFLPFTAGGPQP